MDTERLATRIVEGLVQVAWWLAMAAFWALVILFVLAYRLGRWIATRHPAGHRKPGELRAAVGGITAVVVTVASLAGLIGFLLVRTGGSGPTASATVAAPAVDAAGPPNGVVASTAPEPTGQTGSAAPPGSVPGAGPTDAPPPGPGSAATPQAAAPPLSPTGGGGTGNTPAPSVTPTQPGGNQTGSAGPGPVMISPTDGQVLDSRNDYVFRVRAVKGATGYLYGFNQNATWVWENYHNEHVLSGTEYIMSVGSPAHAAIGLGSLQVWIRALVNGQWTDATIINVTVS
jgi:hypothetical protein